MRVKKEINCEVDPNCSRGITMQERMAMDLIEEYEKKLKAGQNPDPREYIKRYTGPATDEFRTELNLATLLVMAGKKYRQKQNS